jgi:hypothetical protein
MTKETIQNIENLNVIPTLILQKNKVAGDFTLENVYLEARGFTTEDAMRSMDYLIRKEKMLHSEDLKGETLKSSEKKPNLVKRGIL